MIPISEANFVVVDVETTGSDPTRHRITDIGCVTVHNFGITHTFASLIKTRQHIPRYIQKMTGITNEMVATAPEATKVFEAVRNILIATNTFFVAHNSVFDWNFVNESINRNKLNFSAIPHICTLKLARKILPAGIKKNVGALAEYFNIPIQNRHRAFDDASATAHFFIEMLCMLRDRYDINYIEELIDFQNTKIKYTRKIGDNILAKLAKYKQNIPAQMGLLIFIGQNGEVLQIYKANNIKTQIDFLIEQANNSVKKVRSTLQQFCRIEWIETSNELETNIMECRKIMQLLPTHNAHHEIDMYNMDEIFADEITDDLASNASMLVIVQNSKQEKTLDIYCVRYGQYHACVTVGWKANLDNLFDIIQNIFFVSKSKNANIYVKELQIINQWLIKYGQLLIKIELKDKDALTFWTEVENTIRSFYVENK